MRTLTDLNDALKREFTKFTGLRGKEQSDVLTGEYKGFAVILTRREVESNSVYDLFLKLKSSMHSYEEAAEREKKWEEFCAS